MLTKRWMPWAVTFGLLISAALVCGAAWLATSTGKDAQPAAAPCAPVKGQCLIRSVQCRQGSVLINNGDPARTELVEVHKSCCVVLDSSENLGQARLRLVDETPNRLPRDLSVRSVAITRGTSVVTLAVHEIPERLAAVVEWPDSRREPVTRRIETPSQRTALER